MSRDHRRVNDVTLGVLFFEAGVLFLAAGVAWALGVSLSEQVKFRWQAVWLAVAATFPPLLLALWCTRSQWKVLARLRREIEKEVLPLFASCSVPELAAISVLAGVAEESLFRGVLQTALADWLGPAPALVAASTVFGLGHFITPTYALLASVIGLYLGGLLMISDNLLVPILTHGIYDFVALVYLMRR